MPRTGALQCAQLDPAGVGPRLATTEKGPRRLKLPKSGRSEVFRPYAGPGTGQARPPQLQRPGVHPRPGATARPSSLALRAYFARATGGRVLFTTYISTLPKVLELLLERLTLDIAGRVDFRGVHAFASRLMKERGNL